MFWKSKRIKELEKEVWDLKYAVKQLRDTVDCNDKMYLQEPAATLSTLGLSGFLPTGSDVRVQYVIRMIMDHLNLVFKKEPKREFLEVEKTEKKDKKK